jgi:hypothetical protein
MDTIKYTCIRKFYVASSLVALPPKYTNTRSTNLCWTKVIQYILIHNYLFITLSETPRPTVYLAGIKNSIKKRISRCCCYARLLEVAAYCLKF